MIVLSNSSENTENYFWATVTSFLILIKDSKFYTSPHGVPLIFLLFLLIITSPARFLIIFFLFGCALGVFIAFSKQRLKIPFGSEKFSDPKLKFLFGSIYEEKQTREPVLYLNLEEKENISYISPKVSLAIQRITGKIIESYVLNWWNESLNESGGTEFVNCLKSTLIVILKQLIKVFQKQPVELASLLSFGAANALIIQMREYRQTAEEIKGTSKENSQNPPSDAYRLMTKEEDLKHLQKIASILIYSLVPRVEAKSIILNSFLRELLSGKILYPLMQTITDPDAFNSFIIDTLPETRSSSKHASDENIGPGWNLLTVKVIKGSNITQSDPKNISFLPVSSSKYYCVELNICGTSIKTSKLKIDKNGNAVEWNQMFKFKVSEKLLRMDDDLKNVYLPCGFILWEISSSLLKGDKRIGVKSNCNIENNGKPYQIEQKWIDLHPLKSTIENDLAPMLFIEYTWKHFNNEVTIAKEESGATDKKTESDDNIFNEIKQLEMNAILSSNDIFMEMFEFMKSLKESPPYLHFILSLDSFKQLFAATSKTFTTESESLLKRDALDIFETFLSESAMKEFKINLKSNESTNAIFTKLSTEENSSVLYFDTLFDEVRAEVISVLQNQYLNEFKEYLMKKCKNENSFYKSSLLSALKANQAVNVLPLSESETSDKGTEFTTPASDDKRKNIITLISLNKQKIFHLNDNIERLQKEGHSQHGKEMNSLIKQRQELLSNNEQLMNELTVDSASSLPDLNKIHFVVIHEEPSEGFSYPSLMSSTSTNSNDPLFLITATYDKDKFASDANVASFELPKPFHRKYSDFVKLHSILSASHSKVSKLPFPDLKITSISASSSSTNLSYKNIIPPLETRSLTNVAASSSEQESQVKLHSTQLTSALEMYIILLLSDEIIANDRITKNFFLSTNPIEVTQESPHSIQQKVSEGFGKFFDKAAAYIKKTSSKLDFIHAEPPSPLPLNSNISDSSSKIPSKDPSSSEQKVVEFSEEEIDLLIESFFGLLEEIFDINDVSQWFRKQLLNLFKQLTRQAYGDRLGEYSSQTWHKYTKSDDSMEFYLEWIESKLWPSDAEQEQKQLNSENSRLARMIEAKSRLLGNPPEVLVRLLGRYNTVCGLTRIFNMIQHKDWNRQLIYTLLDIIMNLLFRKSFSGKEIND